MLFKEFLKGGGGVEREDYDVMSARWGKGLGDDAGLSWKGSFS